MTSLPPVHSTEPEPELPRWQLHGSFQADSSLTDCSLCQSILCELLGGGGNVLLQEPTGSQGALWQVLSLAFTWPLA